jgi:predicted molibdopterin-dependent oxidoreductase YjgC
MTKEKNLSITIDNRSVEARQGLTILQAARQQGIYIPSLCTLEPLPSYGACRICVVEVDGLRGFPTSCTTPVEDGMVIRTDTAEIRSLRQEILKLLLSEHPASCLFCEDQNNCKEYQGTIRKVGMTTGCRYCPNDTRCELQEVVEKVGLTENSFPVYYRNVAVEKHDPFYDRDYNLCILCGRCVRVCNNIRYNGTLSFKQRGKVTTIGPAFDRSHVDAGCEFCGACLSVCPTGALAAKVSKWYGKPDSQTVSTCTYCPVGCRVLFQTKNDEVLDVLPDYSSVVDHGLLCVKGRFAIPEYLYSPSRFAKPQKRTALGYDETTWEEAIALAAEKLSGVEGEACLMVVSPQLSNEDLFAAQQFARQVLATENIVPSAMIELGGDFAPFLQLALGCEDFGVIEKARSILAVGFDSTYGFSPFGVAVKKAVESGARLVTLSSVDVNLDMYSEIALKPEPGKWAALLDVLINPKVSKGNKGKRDAAKGNGEMAMAGEIFASPEGNVLIAGPQILDAPDRHEILQALLRASAVASWKTIVAHPYTNLAGIAAMGALPGLEPGAIVGMRTNGSPPTPVTFKSIPVGKRRKVVYLIGEVPFEGLPSCDYLIYQNALPAASGTEPDLVLPSCLFPESDGTIINSEGKILALRQAAPAFGESKPDWWILSQIAERLEKGRMKYADVSFVQTEIRHFIKRFPEIKKALTFSPIRPSDRQGPALAPVPDTGTWRYRGIPLAQVVPGMKVLEDGKRTGGLSQEKEKP